jgi:hypothetical protein
MMHRLLRPRWYGHLQHPDEGVLEKNSMTLRGNLHRIVAIGETRFVLSEKMGSLYKEGEGAYQQ